MLRRDVVDAAAAGRFQVFAVRHADEAMEILTGIAAGHPDELGVYPEGTFNGQVQRRLLEWTALRQHFSSTGQGEGD
jgi:hypothetical protein